MTGHTYQRKVIVDNIENNSNHMSYSIGPSNNILITHGANQKSIECRLFASVFSIPLKEIAVVIGTAIECGSTSFYLSACLFGQSVAT